MELITATASVVDDIKQVLSAQGINKNSLRIAMNMGWGGASFYLVLDEPGDSDQVQVIDGIQFVIQQPLIDMFEGFTLESVKRDEQTLFRVIPKVDQDSGGCSSCTSCG